MSVIEIDPITRALVFNLQRSRSIDTVRRESKQASRTLCYRQDSQPAPLHCDPQVPGKQIVGGLCTTIRYSRYG